MNKTAISQNIIKELGLAGLPEEKQAQLLTAMTESVIKRITVKIFEQLTEADQKEFEDIQKTGEPAKLDEFLHSKILNYDQMIKDAIIEYKEEMKTIMADLKEGLEK